MNLDLRLQRALDRVELVSGTIGNPGEGRMCLMSLVAFLAGEEHSDAPSCASPLIQAFAIRINDNMPYWARQRLKLFAPRIIGTNDGLDEMRAEVLCQALAVLTNAPDQYRIKPTEPPRGRRFKLLRHWRRLRKSPDQRLFDCALSSDDGINMASHAARLIVQLARSAPSTRAQENCWNAAIGILDRLCDVGTPIRRKAGVQAEHLVSLAGVPSSREDVSAGEKSGLPLHLLH